jgi:hypothetical protein
VEHLRYQTEDSKTLQELKPWTLELFCSITRLNTLQGMRTPMTKQWTSAFEWPYQSDCPEYSGAMFFFFCTWAVSLNKKQAGVL